MLLISSRTSLLCILNICTTLLRNHEALHWIQYQSFLSFPHQVKLSYLVVICIAFPWIFCSPSKFFFFIFPALQKYYSRIIECLKLLQFLSLTELCNFLVYLISRHEAVFFSHIHFTKALHSFLVLCVATDASSCFNFMPYSIAFFVTWILLKRFVCITKAPFPQFILLSFDFRGWHTWESWNYSLCKVSSSKSHNLSPFTETNQFHWCLKILNYLFGLIYV